MTTTSRFPRRSLFLAILLASLFAFNTAAQSPTFDERASQIERKIEAIQKELQELRDAAKRPDSAPKKDGASEADLAKIRDEGLNRSQVMPTLSYLTDVIGPRLTGSPGLKRANEWSREKLTSWGLGQCAPRSMGTVWPRLVAETIFSANCRAAINSVDRLSQGVDARLRCADHRGCDLSRCQDRSRPGKVQREIERCNRAHRGASRGQSGERATLYAHERG